MEEIIRARKKPNHTFDSSNTRHNIARLLAALEVPRTYLELEALLHMSPRSVRFYIKHLRDPENKRVYLKTYRIVAGRNHAVFAIGRRKDAKMVKMTNEEKGARYRAAVKASPEREARRQRHEKARWLRIKPKPKQSIFSALFM